MFSACLSHCEEILQVDSNLRPPDLILDRCHTTRPPRLHDGYRWFNSHNSSRYCIDLMILGWVDFIILDNFALSHVINTVEPL